VDSLVTTPYGRALLVKAGLVLAVGGLGVANAARLHGWAPRLGAMSRRHLSAEVAAGALVLLTAGVLAETAPPRDVPPPAPPPAAVTRTAVAGDLVVAVSVTPNRPGVNAFTVVAASSRRPAPAPVSGVTLRITEPSGIVAVPLRAVGPGRYFGTARIGEAGDLQLSAVIERGRATIAVPVTPRLAPAVANRPSAPPRPLAPITNVLALVLLTAGAAGGWFVVRTRSRQPPAPTVQAPPRVTASAP
jgi:copper transport protein